MSKRVLWSLVVVLASWSMAWGQQPPRGYLGLAPAPPAAGSNAIVIGEVDPNGPAAKAGIRPGDRIVKVDDQAPAGADALTEMFAKHKPGDKVTIVIQREGKEQKFDVTLAERPDRPGQDRPGPGAPGSEPEKATAFLGVAMQDMTPQLRPRLGVNVDQGVIVAEVTPNSPAAKAGLQSGDVVVQANDKPVATSRQLFGIVQQTGPGKELALKVARGKDTRDVKVTLAEPQADTGAGRPPRPAPRVDIPRVGEDASRMRAMEKRIDELEKRIQDLEKKLNK